MSVTLYGFFTKIIFVACLPPPPARRPWSVDRIHIARVMLAKAELAKICAHIAASLSSWAVATIVSTRAQNACNRNSWSMDVLGLLLVLVQIAAMCLPYVGYHKDGGPTLFPPISCANHYTRLRRLGTWVAFTLLAGWLHAWTILTSFGNPIRLPEAIAMAFFWVPSSGLILLAANPVPLRDYTTKVVARGTETEWLIPVAFRHDVSKMTAINRGVIRCLMAGHLLGALVLIVAPMAGGLLRANWHTKLCACVAFALLTGGHRRLPIFHLASRLLASKVSPRVDWKASPAWTNELNSAAHGRELWKLVNTLGVLEHVFLNALMVVILSYQPLSEVSGPVGWASRAIALLWNAGFASWGGTWWLGKLLDAANKYGEPHSIDANGILRASGDAARQADVTQRAPSRSPVRRAFATTTSPARRPRTREVARQGIKASMVREQRYQEQLQQARRAPASVLPYSRLVDWEARSDEGLSEAARRASLRREAIRLSTFTRIYEI